MNLFSRLQFYGALLICVGLVYSPALQSIGVALIFLWPFLNGKIKQLPSRVIKNPYTLALILYFLLEAASIFLSNDLIEYRRDTIMKLPFLLLPIGLCFSELSRKQVKILLFTFCGAVFTGGLISFIDYLIHFHDYNQLIFVGKPIPILWNKINHIYFSVLLAFCCFFVLVQLLLEKSRYKFWLWLLFALQFMFLHTIAARTGLIAFYVGIIAAIAWFIIRQKKILLGLGLLLLILAGIVSSLLLSPSIQNRVKFSKKDIQTTIENKNPNYFSISMRMEALKTGWHVFLTSPIIGVGPSNIREKMSDEYKKENTALMEENRVKPHNQFLETTIGTGIAGLVILLLVFFLPLRYALFSKFGISNAFFHLLLFGFLVISFASMQVESILERQTGLTFFCLFYLLLSKKHESAHKEH